ncbi:MAG: TRAP transporter substrate-binding protein DctP [Polyangiaceae bacterium]|nr:TRAP transporter substrate-binding protein DctP [Polyangiaceae bacterium]
MTRKITSLALAATAAFLAVSPSQADEKEIRFGTLAPKSSIWGKVFQIWQDAVAEQSQGAVKVTFYWSASQGDEKTMVKDKMLGGSQLDGVACTAVGLSQIWQPILALQSPGLFRTWSKLDAARDGMKSQIVAGFAAKGVVQLGGGDVGVAHLMSKGFEVRGPESLHGHSPYYWADDPVAPHFYTALKGYASEKKSDFSVTQKGKQVPEVLHGLRTGDIDVINVPALAAQQLQWAKEITHIVVQPSGIGIGALVVKQSTLDKLTEDEKKLVLSTGGVAGADLSARVRKADASAFAKMKKEKTAVDLTDDEKAAWEKVFDRARAKLKEGTFDAALLSSLEAHKG